jgi:glyoxalase family protein
MQIVHGHDPMGALAHARPQGEDGVAKITGLLQTTNFMKPLTINPLRGLHHVTAVTANAPANLDFYTRLLGMRLVKKTVNQDDVSAYHLFYADALGSAGTDLTFFDWAYATGTRPGAGTISETALRVLGGGETLKRWAEWFDKNGVKRCEVENRHGLESLPFQDPEGQRLRLVAEPRTDAEGSFHPWKGSPVGFDAAIVGLSAVTLSVHDFDATAEFLTEVLGFRANPSDPALFETGDGGPGTQARLEISKNRAIHGAGGVHHVAWLVADVKELLAWQERIESFQLSTSGKVDRHYFQSLYFRIPEGILFEIATAGPGFTADGEDLEHLGERLSLPPFLEPQRARIEAGIKPLEYKPVHIIQS